MLDDAFRSLELSELWTGTIFLLAVIGIMSILDLPMSAYRIFGLEQKFGFNKMTVRIFIMDIIKNTLLGLLIGTPLLIFVLWIMNVSGNLWWLYVWMTWFGFSLFMMWAYPGFIAPLFNKFRPLQEGELKTRIEKLLERNGFTSQGIFVMDGSTRSTHGNAYFTGLGANKRIVFFDTLIDELSHDEIEAVLAHELGHFKCHHIKKTYGVHGRSVTCRTCYPWLVDRLTLVLSGIGDFNALKLYGFIVVCHDIAHIHFYPATVFFIHFT